MAKSILISIQPKWCELIASGEKTIEVRKTRPKLEPPFKCYIYCTKNGDALYSVNAQVQPCNSLEIDLTLDSTVSQLNGYVIGEFVCDKIYDCDADSVGLFDKSEESYLPECCLTWREIFLYSRGALPLYGWRISNLVIYDKPKDLSELQISSPPQSWCYVGSYHD